MRAGFFASKRILCAHCGRKCGALGGPAIHADALVAPRPRFAAIVAAINSRRRNADDDAIRIARVRQHRMQTEPAEAGHPERALGVIQQRLVGLKRLAAIIGAIERGRIGSRENHLGAEERRGLERPDRIERKPAAHGKLHIALGRLIPARAEIVGPAHSRAPMLTLHPIEHARRFASGRYAAEKTS